MHTVWKGSISFGLVSIPVRLVSASEEKAIAFRQVHAADGGLIKYRRVCEVGGHEVEFEDIAKGYELPDGDLLVLTDEDLENVPIPTGRTIEVLGFTPTEDVDRVALSRAYFCEPIGDVKPYVLLRDALSRSGRLAVAKIALRQRERLSLLWPRDGVLVLQTMWWPDEVRRPDFGFLGQDVSVAGPEMRMAQSYIQALSGALEPDAFVDTYRSALREVLDAKAAGRETRPTTVPTADGSDMDLMDALRRSVDAAKRERSGPLRQRRAATAQKAKKTASRRTNRKVTKP